MDADRLLAEADIRAERITALVRIAVSAILATVLFVTVWRSSIAQDPAFARQIARTGGTLLAYFALGLVSLIIAHPRRFRPWMPLVFTTCDIVFLFSNLAFQPTKF